MHTSRVIASALVAAALSATAVQAGMLNPSDWTASLTPSTAGTNWAIDNPGPLSIKMTYWFDTEAVHNGVSAMFSTTAAQSGALTIDWNYVFWHQWYNPTASLTFFADSASGIVETNVFSAWPAYQGTSVSGTTTLNLSQGYSWGLRVTGRNLDSNTAISGIVTLTPVPAPGAMALLGLAGAFGARRARR